MTGPSDSTEAREIYLLGIGTGHSVGPQMHNYIAKSLNLPWTYHTKECATIEDCLALLRSPICVGAAMTMPFKHSIIPHLHECDELVRTLNACNTVSKTADVNLRGTNLDWCGIAGALKEGQDDSQQQSGKPGLIIGAGGAARAAVYALATQMGCSEIYILNRDEQEVVDLQADMSSLNTTLTHVTAEAQASTLPTPAYIIGTIPDFEPQTPEEKSVKQLLTSFLSRSEKGVLLDMCYRPRRTRHVQLGESYGWRTVEGWRVVGHQAEVQWRAWADERVGEFDVDWEGVWEVLGRAADESLLVTPQDGEEKMA